MTLADHFDLVIFDWAGTVVDFGCRAPVNALMQVFHAHGVTLTEQEVRADMGKAKADHVDALLRRPRIADAWTAANGQAADANDRNRIVTELGPLMCEQAGRSASLIDGARSTVDALRAAGLKIASSTGYTRDMMAPVLDRAAAQGYAPDHLLCSGETSQGRPSPLMIYRACVELAVWPLSRVVKVDDTETGVVEGRSAGCFTVGVAASGNGVGLSAADLAALSDGERDTRIAAAAQSLHAAGADLVIDSIADLVPALQSVADKRAVEKSVLLTPGPLTTSAKTRAAMLTDWGSWDPSFIALTASVCRDLLTIANAERDYACVPLQGSGTFAVEAALGTLVPKHGKVLVADNGAYCKRMVRILQCLGRQSQVLPHDEREPASAARIDAALAADPSITHVAQVHCETGTGILNPLTQIAAVVARRGRALIIDAMSTFGAIPIDAGAIQFDALITASGKCLEGVPGMGIIIARRAALEICAGNSPSLALDLFDQWQYLQKTGQWRFTPPTQVVAALRAALDQFHADGGQTARGARYRANCDALVESARGLGLQTFLDDDLQAPIIVTLHAPADPAYAFGEFYRRVRDRGFILYPGKLTAVDTFRVGCIGAIGPVVLRQAASAIGGSLRDMGVRHFGHE